MKEALAIVIPAFKDKYLKQTLNSLASQTCKNFDVYIGDDNSPHDIKATVAEFAPQLNIHYNKFQENMGGRSLAAQWERCIRMADKAQWVWLFSDDDFMDANCVEHFYTALNHTESSFDLYRFNTKVVDAGSKYTDQLSNHPSVETSFEFLQRRLKGETLSFAVEYIFKKDVFWKKGGFVKFPLAWTSDDIAWTTIAEDNGIYTIAGASVYWRFSGDNISSVYEKNRQLKKKASRKYMSWAKNWLLKQGKYSYKDQLIGWYIKQLGIIGYGGRKQLFLYELPWICFFFKVLPFKIISLYKKGL